MKTRRSRSSLYWLSRQASRPFKTSRRFDAYVLLCGIGSIFAHDLVTFEEAADRARPKDRLNLCRNSSMVISGDASSRATIVAW